MDQIAPGVFVATEYGNVNVGFLAVAGGAVAIDAPTLPARARTWREVIEGTAGRIQYVVLTDAHPDRLFSAGLLGAPIIAARAAYEQAAAYTDGYWRAIVEGWGRRYPGAAEELAAVRVALPEVLLTKRLTLHRGEDEVTVECVAGAAPGSVWVRLSGRDVVFVGDTVVTTLHPFFSTVPDTGAWLETLRELRRDRNAALTIVPGRGPVCKGGDTKLLSDYLSLARRRVRSLLGAGRPRADTSSVVAELWPLFPVPDDERDLVQRRIKAGLDRLYEELRQNSNVEEA